MRTRRWINISFPFLLLFGLYVLGPKPERPVYSEAFPHVPENPGALEAYIRSKEQVHNIKHDNEARIIWNDTARKRTEYAVIYLHGFSASPKEGDPVHRWFAERFGCNLFLSRLSDHGVDTTEALVAMTADRLWNSAKEALAIGSRIGEKVIIMSTSTGGTLALKLAASYPGKVHALINMSPNIEINDPAAFLLNGPWGLHIARLVMGGNYRETETSGEEAKYWNTRYRLEALVELEELLESAMVPETFRSVSQPSLTLYYYKNEVEQDPQVKVSAMLEMHALLATPDSLKKAVAIPDAGAHVIGSYMTSRDVEGVFSEMERFAVSALQMHEAPAFAITQ